MCVANRHPATSPQSAPPIDRELALFPLMAELLEYPAKPVKEQVERITAADLDACPEAASELGMFQEDVSKWSWEQLEEQYVRTFDVTPQCVPYVSIHIFGEESFKRANLMTGLREAYSRAVFDPGRELPDHLAVVLRFFPLFSEEERSDLARYCLHEALEKMITSLQAGNNPYVHVLRAVAAVLRKRHPKEAAHA